MCNAFRKSIRHFIRSICSIVTTIKPHASRGSNHLRRTPENPLNAHPFKLQCAVRTDKLKHDASSLPFLDRSIDPQSEMPHNSIGKNHKETGSFFVFS